MEKNTIKRRLTHTDSSTQEPERGKDVMVSTSSHIQQVKKHSVEKSRSAFTSSKSQGVIDKPEKKEASKKARGDCKSSESSSHTQFYKKDRFDETYHRITTDDFFGMSESISGTSDTRHCVHGPEGRLYTEKGLLKRNILKNLDPVPKDPKWVETCDAICGWDMVKTLEFLVNDPMGVAQSERLEEHLRDFAKIIINGYKIDLLDSVCTVVDYLVESMLKNPKFRECLVLLLENMSKPILLNLASDVTTYFETLRNYLGYMGYLLMRLEDEDLFDLASKALIWQLSAPDHLRGQGSAHLRHTLAAAAPVLYETVVRMLAVATTHKFPTFMDIALLLACDTVDNCMELMKENIIENIFYRFNPYFPDRMLPVYDINPADVLDFNIRLGQGSVHMSTTLSLLLVLLKTVKHYLKNNPDYRRHLPCPDSYAQRCFVWAFRYECRAPEHRHERSTLAVIAGILLHIFEGRLNTLTDLLMQDILTLSVLSEIPPRADWTGTVCISTSQIDVQFKKILIFLCVEFLKIFPFNNFMIQSRHWLVGLMYLLDPGLSHLRPRWSPTLFAEIRKTSLQALVCTLPLISYKLVKECGVIRRIMWYIEWYSEMPYELPVLYWCVRLLQVAIYNRETGPRKDAIQTLFDTHGIVILINLCNTLLKQKLPPVEKGQVIIALNLRLITSAVENTVTVSCCVYPGIKWPVCVNSLATKMLDTVLYSLEKHFIVSDNLYVYEVAFTSILTSKAYKTTATQHLPVDLQVLRTYKWLISLLNFIWEAVIWNPVNRDIFIAKNGVYKLLDLITMARVPVQCLALAVTCDAARAGKAVGQLVTWRANIGANTANPNLVKRGSTVASLLAAIFKDECRLNGVPLSEKGVIEDIDLFLMSREIRLELNDPDFRTSRSQRTAMCLAAADMAGSRLSKAFALLDMLSNDLQYKVRLADETYNLYKNIQLVPEDEAVLLLCSHYLTMKLNEAWLEAKVQSCGLVPEDDSVIEEFLHIGKGWAKEVQRQQEDVIKKDRKKEQEEESSMYAFIGRVRLNIALDALREVRCVARSADRTRISHVLLHEAVHAHHRRFIMTKKLDAPVLRTYGPSLDDQNITGHNVKVFSNMQPNKRDIAISKPSS